jgi:hypothetical protein
MAFEALVAAAEFRRDRAQRVGVAVSLALHIPPVALFALQLVLRPVLVERTEEVPAPQAALQVPVKIARIWAPATPPREPARAAHTPAGSAPARQPPRRKPRAVLPAPPALLLPSGGEVLAAEPPAVRHEIAMLPAEKPSPAEMERRAAAVQTEILAGLSADPAVPPTMNRSAGPHATGDGDSRTGPTDELTAGAAAYLRTYETFPSLPDGSWSWRSRSHVFVLQVCVAESGQVDRVLVNRGSRPDLDSYLAGAIRTWRYRPWIVSGAPRPFCHPLRITYSRG